MAELTEQDLLNIDTGMEAARISTQEADYNKKLEWLNSAVQLLNPYKQEKFKKPRVAFGLGVLFNHASQATKIYIDSVENDVKNNPDTDITEEAFNQYKEAQTKTADQMHEVAIEHFKIAAAMQDYEDNCAPAMAKNSLGTLATEDANLEEAFKHYLDAAEDGLAEAQINVAIMFYRGEGVKQSSVFSAKRWLDEAEKNKDQLNSSLQNELQTMLNEVEEKLKPNTKKVLKFKP